MSEGERASGRERERERERELTLPRAKPHSISPRRTIMCVSFLLSAFLLCALSHAAVQEQAIDFLQYLNDSEYSTGPMVRASLRGRRERERGRGRSGRRGRRRRRRNERDRKGRRRQSVFSFSSPPGQTLPHGHALQQPHARSQRRLPLLLICARYPPFLSLSHRFSTFILCGMSSQVFFSLLTSLPWRLALHGAPSPLPRSACAAEGAEYVQLWSSLTPRHGSNIIQRKR